MAWQALEFEVSGADVEALSDALFDAGALSIDVTYADEGSVKERAIYLEPGEEILLSWGYNLVVGLFDKDIEVAYIFSFVSDVLQPLQLSPPQTRLVDDQDWVRLTQQHSNNFNPFKSQSAYKSHRVGRPLKLRQKSISFLIRASHLVQGVILRHSFACIG